MEALPACQGEFSLLDHAVVIAHIDSSTAWKREIEHTRMKEGGFFFHDQTEYFSPYTQVLFIHMDGTKPTQHVARLVFKTYYSFFGGLNKCVITFLAFT